MSGKQISSSAKQSVRLEYSYWLLPEEALKMQYQAWIEELAQKYDAPRFDAHVTLYCGPSDESESCRLAKKMVERSPPLSLIPERVNYSEIYTKTLFIQFAESQQAKQMLDELRQSLSQSSSYLFNPHLSLIYKTMTEETQAQLARNLSIPKAPCVFDRLRVIETEVPLTLPEQIKKWRIVFDAPFVGSP